METAGRDAFTPRPLDYFRTMWRAMTNEDPDRLRLYLAAHEGDLVAATTMVRVGEHAWYSYGASSTDRREVRGSNAVQWQMLRDALAVLPAERLWSGTVAGFGHGRHGAAEFAQVHRRRRA